MSETIGLAKSSQSAEPLKPIIHKDLGEVASQVEPFSAPISVPYELYAQLNLDPFKATETEKQWISEVYEYAKNQVPDRKSVV